MTLNDLSSSQKLSRPIKVMIVDDSAIIRSVIEKFLKVDSNIEICGFASNGAQAVQTVGLCNPDILILDIEMPVMDGITAIPLLLEKKPELKILMCSTLSDRGADISIKALSLGATDCILKPGGTYAIGQQEDFSSHLLKMVRTLGESVQSKPSLESVSVRNMTGFVSPQIIAIGSSTGGPKALTEVLRNMRNLPVPIVITQHMPKTFTKMLAAHLSNDTGVACIEGESGMVLEPGCAYIAPGGYHMVFNQIAGKGAIVLNNGPMENFCKPAVDPMLRSLVEIYKSRILMIMLTGMGHDGLAGTKMIVNAGGHVNAQDAKTSVVWGMPGAIAEAGLCNAVLPINDIAPHVKKICRF